MTVTDDLLADNERFNGPLPLPPAKHLVVLARLNVYGACSG